MDAKIRYARTSDGVDIAYALQGEGPLLLVARPLLRAAVDTDLQWFDSRLPQLAETRTLVTWDWRGMGLSSTARTEYTLESTVCDVEAVVEALAEPRLDLLAYATPCHSAIAFAAAHPEAVRRLALRNPAFPGSSPRGTVLREMPDIMASDFKSYVQLAALRIYGWDGAEAAKRWEQHMTALFDADSWLRLMEQMEQLDANEYLPDVQARTLVIQDPVVTAGFGRTSRAVSAAHQRHARLVTATVPHAQLTVISAESDRSYVDAVEEFLSAGDTASAETPHGTAIILFADIVDSTAITERLGDTAFRTKSRDLDAALRSIIGDCGGSVIDAKTLGDGVLATFPAASQAIDAALRLEGAATASGLQLHVGLHAGDVIREDGNVFGGAVNIAARISSMSAPGEVLVSATVRDLARTSAGVTFEDCGEQSLKGVGEPVRVFAVRGLG